MKKDKKLMFIETKKVYNCIRSKRGEEYVNIPEEYTCSLCGYAFLEGEVPELFCPNCGSSMVEKELTYEEFIDDDTITPRIITL